MADREKHVIGVTGGIACGKSTICRILEKEGYLHIDADDVAHDILQDGDVQRKIAEAFGTDLIREDSTVHHPLVDRKKLGAIVFADAEKLQVLEHITHPRIIQKIEHIIQNLDQDVVIEAVELISSGLAEVCDHIWYVYADERSQIERLMKTRSMSRADAELRLAAQQQNDWDLTRMDAVINSSRPREVVREDVLRLLKEI